MTFSLWISLSTSQERLQERRRERNDWLKTIFQSVSISWLSALLQKFLSLLALRHLTLVALWCRLGQTNPCNSVGPDSPHTRGRDSCHYDCAFTVVGRDTSLPTAQRCQECQAPVNRRTLASQTSLTSKPSDRIQLRGLLHWAQDSLLVYTLVDSGLISQTRT